MAGLNPLGYYEAADLRELPFTQGYIARPVTVVNGHEHVELHAGHGLTLDSLPPELDEDAAEDVEAYIIRDLLNGPLPLAEVSAARNATYEHLVTLGLARYAANRFNLASTTKDPETARRGVLWAAMLEQTEPRRRLIVAPVVGLALKRDRNPDRPDEPVVRAVLHGSSRDVIGLAPAAGNLYSGRLPDKLLPRSRRTMR